MNGVVEGQIAGALIESHILFVEDDRPLHGRAVHDLAPATMAGFGVQGLGSFQGI